jgi:hypothetical protein
MYGNVWQCMVMYGYTMLYIHIPQPETSINPD